MRKVRTWADNINDVYRDILFPDEELRKLMLIPDADAGDISIFRDKYFVRTPMPDELITDENVRIVFYEERGDAFGDPRVRLKYLTFDIYVKRTVLYTADVDRLKSRGQLIAQKLRELLTDEPYVCHMKFTYEDDYDLAAKTTGYARHHIVFSYKATY